MSDPTPEWDHPDIPPPPPKLPAVRNSSNGLIKPPHNQRDRDVWAAERWVKNNWNYRQIAAAMDISVSTAHASVERGLREPNAEREQRAAEARQLARARLELLHEAALEVLDRKHITVSHGKVIMIKDEATGEEKPLIDDAPVLQAIDRLLRINESWRRLDGMDQPAKVEHSGGVKYELIGIDPADLR